MFGRLFEKFVTALFRLRFDKVVDVFRKGYDRQKLTVLKTKFKTVGDNFYLEPRYTVVNPQYMAFGDNVRALYNFRIEAIDRYHGARFSPAISIGSHVYFNTDCHIGCINRVSIGNNVLVASRVYIADHAHGEITHDALRIVPTKRPLVTKGPVIIEDNVWIGEGVCILHGVTIGANAIIGANAVVTKDVAPNTVVGGIPAKPLKTLHP